MPLLVTQCVCLLITSTVRNQKRICELMIRLLAIRSRITVKGLIEPLNTMIRTPTLGRRGDPIPPSAWNASNTVVIPSLRGMKRIGIRTVVGFKRSRRITETKICYRLFVLHKRDGYGAMKESNELGEARRKALLCHDCSPHDCPGFVLANRNATR